MSEKTRPNQNQIPALAWKAIRHILSQGKQSDRILVRGECLPAGFGSDVAGDDGMAAADKPQLLKGWACTVDFEYSIVFEFVPDAKAQEETILLEAVGTHNEVY